MPMPTIARSLSFQDIFLLRRTTASPLDIPGASRPTASRKCLLTKSLPENADAVLSRSLLQQCHIEDQAADLSPRSSLKECSSWTSRPFAQVTTSDHASCSLARKGPNRPARMVPRIRKRSTCSGACNMSPVGVETIFTKTLGSTRRNEGRVSALSAALSASAPPSNDRSSIANQAERLRTQSHPIPQSIRE